MALLRNRALSDHPVLTRYPNNRQEWNRWVRALDSQSIVAAAISGGIESVDALPSLPDSDYPQSSVVFLTTDSKLYRNTDGSTWSRAVDGNDLEANSVLTNSIAAGAITAAKIASDTITANEIASNTITASEIAATTITATELNISTLSAITADMGSITAGNIVLSEFIRSGQTDYDTGTGFWLGDDGGTVKFSIGDDSGDKLTWNGSILELVGELEFNQVKSFTPTWNGFSSDPSGDILYIKAGDYVILWPENAQQSFSGTSDANDMEITNLPTEIRPAQSASYSSPFIVHDSNGNNQQGIAGASLSVLSFFIASSSSGIITYDTTGFQTSGTKGWTGHIMYPLSGTTKSV